MAMTITKTVDQLSNAFMGMNSFRFAKTSGTIAANTVWDLEFPVDKENMSFEQGEQSTDKAYIFGKAAAYGSVMGTPADITLTFFVPSLCDDLMSYFLEKQSSTPATVSDSALTFTPVAGYKFSTKKLSGMALLINEDKTKALAIKNLEGFASIKYDPTGATPAGFTVTLNISGINTADTDGDIVFYNVTAVAQS